MKKTRTSNERLGAAAGPRTLMLLVLFALGPIAGCGDGGASVAKSVLRNSDAPSEPVWVAFDYENVAKVEKALVEGKKIESLDMKELGLYLLPAGTKVNDFRSVHETMAIEVLEGEHKGWTGFVPKRFVHKS